MRVDSVTTNHGEEVTLGNLTILVGPNNTGKSQTLSDIHSVLQNQLQDAVILDDYEIEWPDTWDGLVGSVRIGTNNRGDTVFRGISAFPHQGSQERANPDSLRNIFENEANYESILQTLGQYNVAYLDTSSRLDVALQSNSLNPAEETPSSLLQALFIDDTGVEDELGEAFANTFDKDIRLDYSSMQNLSLRVADRFQEIPPDPRESYDIMQQYNKIDEEGDGYRSFVGVVLSILLLESRVILLDEPEAFLHPAQVRELGLWIGNHANTTSGQIIISTHNSNFIAGLLSGSSDVDIYRLNRVGNHTTYNHISSELTNQLATDPLLSSQRVLDAIFHKGVVVCEGDYDRTVYRRVAVNELETDQLLFVHSHNKQTIRRVTSILREADIPVAAITDFDLIRDHYDLKYLLESLTENDVSDILDNRRIIEEAVQDARDEEILESMIPEIVEFLDQLRNDEHTLSGANVAIDRISRDFDEWNPVKNNGLSGLPEEVSEVGQSIIGESKEYGLFMVPTGQLEGWMDLGISRKSRWVIEALNVISEGDCEDNLVGFIQEIESYLEDEYTNLIEV